MEIAGIDDGAAGVGVRGGQDLDAGAGLDESEGRTDADVLDDGIDDDVGGAEGVGAGVGGGGGRDAHDHGVRGRIDGTHIGAADDARAGHGHAGVDARGARDGIKRDGGRTENEGVGRGAGEALRAGGVAVDDELRQRGGQAAADGRGAERDRLAVVAAEHAAESEREHVGGGAEGDLVVRVTGETDHVRGGRTGREGGHEIGAERGGGVGLGDELGELAGAEVGVIAGETAVTDDADAGDGIVSGVVLVVDDGPGADQAAGRGGERSVKDDARSELGLSETVRAREVDGRAGDAAEARGEKVGAPEGGAGSGHANVAVAFEQADGAEALGVVGVDESVEGEGTAVQRDRGEVVDAVERLHHRVVAVVDLDAAVRDIDRAGVAQLGLVTHEEAIAADERGSSVGLERAQGQRPGAGDSREIDVGALHGAPEAEVILADHEGGRSGGSVGDDAAGASLAAEGAQPARVEQVAVQIERAVALDVEDVAGSAEERVAARGELERAFEHGGLTAVILLGRDLQRAAADLDQVGVGDDRALKVESRAVGDVEVAGGVGGEDVARTGRGGRIADAEGRTADDFSDVAVARDVGA